jgi:hypothetical protein
MGGEKAPPHDEAPIGANPSAEENSPPESEEAVFLSSVREEADSFPPGPPAAENESLPPVEELVRQIPEALRTTLDELFRARFTRVMRVQAEEGERQVKV